MIIVLGAPRRVARDGRHEEVRFRALVGDDAFVQYERFVVRGVWDVCGWENFETVEGAVVLARLSVNGERLMPILAPSLPKSSKPDFELQSADGGIVVQPLTPACRAWLKKQTGLCRPWFPTRMVWGVVEEMRADGLVGPRNRIAKGDRT